MTEKKRELLFLDYKKANDFIDKVDGQLFLIRKWTLLSCSGVIAFGISTNHVVVIAANFLLIPCFMMMEAVYKSLQNHCISKSFHLEKLLYEATFAEQADLSSYTFGIGHTLEPPTIRNMTSAMFSRDRWHVSLLYALLFVVTVFACVFTYLVDVNT